MSILDRYISAEFWKSFFGSLLAFLTLFMSANALRQGVQEEIPAVYAFQYTLYQIPEIIVMLFPASCLMGTLICLSSMARKNELVAMFANGISLARIAFVLLCLVFIVCCISFIVTDRVLPPLSKAKAHFYRTVIEQKPDRMTDINQNRIWYRSNNLIYNIGAFDSRKDTILGISIYTFDEAFNLVQQLEAKRALFEDDLWQLEDGVVTIFEGDPPFPLSQPFVRKPVKLEEKPEDFREIEREVETLRLKHLWRFITRNAAAGIDTNAYEVLFWSKISMALVPLVMAILAIPFGVYQQRHSSLVRDITVCFFLIIVYWLFYSTALSMGKSGTIPPLIAAWLPSVVFFILGVSMILRGRRT